MTNICPIWGTPAEFSPPCGDYVVVKSERCGGTYRVAGSASLDGLTGQEKAKLTSWLAEQRRLGDHAPMIKSQAIDAVKSSPTPSVLDRRDRALEFLAQECPTLGSVVRLIGAVDEGVKSLKNGLTIETCSQNHEEAIALLAFLESSALIAKVGNYGYRITFDGWTYLERQRAAQVASVQAFVAMWFNPSVADAYHDGILPAISETGYSPMRIDQKEHNNKIDDEIIAEIRRSRFVVADFTSAKHQPRGGVYFEAGFAMGLNKPVIWTCREDMIDQVHFDTRQFNHITWTSPSDLRQKLKVRIGAVLGDGPLPKTS